MATWYETKQKVGVVLPEQSLPFLSAFEGFSRRVYDRTPWLMVPFVGPHAYQLLASYPQELIAVVGDFGDLPANATCLRRFSDVISWRGEPTGATTVQTDLRNTGCTVAAFFQSIGLERVSILELPESSRSPELNAGFLSHADAHNLEAEVFCPESDAEIGDWIASLALPHGVFGCDDWAASKVYRYAMDLDLLIPDRIAVIGCGNNPLACDISGVDSLSSVELPMRQIGEASADLLIDRLVHGQADGPERVRLGPANLIHRFSTSRAYYRDQVVLRAVQWIEENYQTALNTTTVAQEIGVSRRTLERHFRESLGSTVQKEVERIRFQRACQLLLGPRMSLEAIAFESGIPSAWQLNRVFKRRLGKNPTQYRQDTLSGLRRD